jgi:hypothetical protein
VNWDGRLECDICRSTYTIYAASPSEYPRLASIADVREKERLVEEWRTAEKALMTSVPVRALLDRLTNRIEREPSVAGTYRLLKNFCGYYTYGTFNRHWKGASAWVKEWVQSSAIPAVLKLLGEDDPELVSEAERVAELWNRSQQPVPAIKIGAG